MVDLNNVDSIYIFYLLKKNTREDFKFPYQGTGKAPVTQEYYTLDTSFKNRLPENTYIPHEIESIQTTTLIKQL